MIDQAITKAAALSEALSYIQRFHNKVVVVKIGGSIMDDEQALSNLLSDIVFMNYVGMQPVLVHGGGKAINQAMETAGLVPQMVQGRRYTDERTLAIAEHVLCNQINKFIVSFIQTQGCEAMGLHSLSSVVLFAEKTFLNGGDGRRIDLGLVGEVKSVNARLLHLLVQADSIPVIATIARDTAGGKLNVNADTAAGAVAASMKAEKLVVVSDTHGIRKDPNDPESRVSHLTVDQIDAMVKSGAITSGMLPKVEACIEALKAGVTKAHIIDGRIPHALLLEIYTQAGIGTEIVLWKDFIAIADHSPEQLRHMLDVSKRLKKQLKETGRNDPILAGKVLALIFEKPSLRTRVSFSAGMTQLGGSSLMLRGEEMGWGHREEVRDVARVIASMCDGIMARTFEHEKVIELAKWAKVPVINGLTDYNHPCQAMADVLTIEEHFGKLAGLRMAFIGDGNNMTRSLAVACGKFEMRFVLATPAGYELPPEDIDRIMSHVPELDFVTTRDPFEAVREADIIVTDTWVSMGQEAEKARRIREFGGFQVDAKLLERAPKTAVVLHCLPAYRGLEISDEVIESDRALVFQEAENRLHAQKGILAVLMGGL